MKTPPNKRQSFWCPNLTNPVILSLNSITTAKLVINFKTGIIPQGKKILSKYWSPLTLINCLCKEEQTKTSSNYQKAPEALQVTNI